VSSAKPQTGQLCAIRAESIVDEIRRYSFNLSFAVSAMAAEGVDSSCSSNHFTSVCYATWNGGMKYSSPAFNGICFPLMMSV
jgi:hypothetical protein